MNELMEIANRVGAALKRRGDTIAVAESSAGGFISASLLAVPGASAYFQGGGVCYTRGAKIEFMDIPPAILDTVRSSSEPHAEILARAAKDRLSTTWGLAETGASGPTGNRYGDAAGHTCIAIDGPVSKVATIETGSGDRAENMLTFAKEALLLLEKNLD
jgi:nicotinamide-nucleotide amidase